MPNLFDLLTNAQNGNAIAHIAKQFDLSQQQTQHAIEALLPAFSQGLKRNTSTPGDLGSFLCALSSGQHAKYFEDASNAFSQQGVQEGNGILGHLFGSRELSRTIASQAAQATGTGQDILKQMLPVLASMIMGGLFKQSTEEPGIGTSKASANPLQVILEQMMQQGRGAQMQPQTQPNSLDNPFGKMFENMLGAGQPIKPRAEPQAKTNPSGRARTPYDDLFGDMFEAGAKTRDDYQKNMESVFDQFLQGMKQSR